MGRSPFAGPVVAAAVTFPAWEKPPAELDGLTDSKKLSKSEREHYAGVIRDLGRVGLGAASAREIDTLNIHHASLLAMGRAYRQMGPSAHALVDGKFAPDIACPATTVVKGDSQSLSIAAASVVAKVARDRLMAELDRRYPGYGWADNVGYGTEDHFFGLLRLGTTPHHRLSFNTVQSLTADLMAQGLRFAGTESAAPGHSLLSLRRNYIAVFDGAGHHIGFLKSQRGDWAFLAVGYTDEGQPLTGEGPCACLHGRSIETPDSPAVSQLLASIL